MKKLRVLRANGQLLSGECVVARSFVARLVGLLNHSRLEADESLLLEPCNQVHTFFMRFPIDAVFLSKDNTVMAVAELKPWRMSRLHFGARKVLELPLGRSRALGLAVGERLEMT